jgi:fluoride exporter
VILVVALAGALGAVVRFLAARFLAAWAVLLVNVVGSFIAGAATAAIGDPQLQLIVITGFCGGLTTFSTFSVETVQFATAGRWRRALVNVATNLVLGLAAAALGLWVGGFFA